MLAHYSAKLAPFHRVYVPLCGKSLDMVYLAQAGHQVIGTDLATLAFEQFFQEQQLSPSTISRGRFRVHVDGPFTLLEGDAFKIDVQDVDGPVDAIYDRASLVAVDPKTRVDFVESLYRVLKPGGALLLIVFEYDQSKLDGPPWSVRDEDVRKLFHRFGTVSLLETRNEPVGPRFIEAGITSMVERAYWIEKAQT